MNVDVAASDERAVEVLASGLPVYHGAQLAVDITLRSALSASGLPRFNAAVVDGAVCGRARDDKERKCAELLHGDRCRLVVVALETEGGGARRQWISLLGWQLPGPARQHPCSAVPRTRGGGADGLAWWQFRAHALLRPR